MEAVVIACFAIGIIFGLLGAWIAGQKRRGAFEGFFLGFLFGPLGCLIAALLPTKESPPWERREVDSLKSAAYWRKLDLLEAVDAERRRRRVLAILALGLLLAFLAIWGSGGCGDSSASGERPVKAKRGGTIPF